jgi:hypothetical protein
MSSHCFQGTSQARFWRRYTSNCIVIQDFADLPFSDIELLCNFRPYCFKVTPPCQTGVPSCQTIFQELHLHLNAENMCLMTREQSQSVKLVLMSYTLTTIGM